MSTIWDHAVRAVQPVFDERDAGGEPLAYYCGGRGSESFCDHQTCRAVAALAGADMLHYPPNGDQAHVGRSGSIPRGPRWHA